MAVYYEIDQTTGPVNVDLRVSSPSDTSAKYGSFGNLTINAYVPSEWTYRDYYLFFGTVSESSISTIAGESSQTAWSYRATTGSPVCIIPISGSNQYGYLNSSSIDICEVVMGQVSSSVAQLSYARLCDPFVGSWTWDTGTTYCIGVRYEYTKGSDTLYLFELFEFTVFTSGRPTRNYSIDISPNGGSGSGLTNKISDFPIRGNYLGNCPWTTIILFDSATIIGTKSGLEVGGWSKNSGGPIDSDIPTYGTNQGIQINPGVLSTYYTTIYAIWINTSPHIYFKGSGNWFATSAIYFKQNGAWKKVNSMYIKQNGVWRKSR